MAGREGSAAEARLLGEPGRPWVSLMMSLPRQTETHWMIMPHIGQKSRCLAFSFPTPPSQPRRSPSTSISPAASISPYPPFSPVSAFPSYPLHQCVRPPPPTLPPPDLDAFIFGLPDFLTTPPIWSGGTLRGTLVKSDDALLQRWHLINGNLILGMSREEVVFFMSCSIIE